MNTITELAHQAGQFIDSNAGVHVIGICCVLGLVWGTRSDSDA